MGEPHHLAGFALLADLTEAQLAQVAAMSTLVTIEAGRLIIEEGREADHCWLIRSGQVALETRLPNAASSTVQTLGAGDVLGWSWLLPPYRWSFDGVATTQVTAVEIDAVGLRTLADEDRTLGYPIAVGLVQVLADRLHGTRARLIDLYGSPRAG